MTTGDLLLFMLGAPFAIAAGAWLGRRAQRFLWKLDWPYTQRVDWFKAKK